MGPHQGNFIDYGAEPVKVAREWKKGSYTRVNAEIVGKRGIVGQGCGNRNLKSNSNLNWASLQKWPRRDIWMV